ncbi:hypothetical protein M0R45_017483 [Rubus argutus]|uniref:TIR domain-containing protein n=1 Tax=Rubus argutus TaxID=59490 RepID=A0AAW1XYH2_RUBAR
MALFSQRASASLLSAESLAPKLKYDMFLSFSGKDTRRGIVSSLYHELLDRKFKPFMDSKELEAGTEISSHLLTAIQESKSAIVFLSPNYASSTWCLEELANIVQRLEARNILVLPVFYNVDPSDVRHQIRTFAEAFTRHEQRFSQDDGIEKVKRWRAALTKVANLSGLESNKYESDRELVQDILQLVHSKLTRQAIDRILWFLVYFPFPSLFSQLLFRLCFLFAGFHVFNGLDLVATSLPAAEPASQWKHDVFLSFTGEDTQEGLISHLYHQLHNTRGITTFKDDGQLKKWTDISIKLLNAIEESRFAIVVLTPNYASSTWCLDVLTKVFQFMKDKNRILPLFYNVDPSDVRNQKGSFELAFTKHENKSSQDPQKVKQWNLGLKKVSNLIVWDSKNYESETKLVEHILEVVCSKVQKAEKSETSIGYFEAFEPTRHSVDKIMEMLQHDEVAIVGVCGMGGVGKTTMVKYVGAQAPKIGIFDHVIMAVVSRSPDLRKIQGTLADMLGLKLHEETEIERARRLHERLMRGRILIILDDIWKIVDLSSIGIPGHKELKSGKSKLLITSRSGIVCHSMGCQATIHLNVLSEKKSWNLFAKEARQSFDKSTNNFYDIVWQVVRACAGLPIALIIVARALRDRDLTKDLAEWNEAVRRLTAYHSPDLDYEEILFECINLSYDFLRSDDAKSCFYLCCLFPHEDLGIEDLLRYGIGKGLFQDSNIQNARAKVRLGVKYLKDSGLLMDTELDECVRMHGIMRNMVMFVASYEDVLSLQNTDFSKIPETYFRTNKDEMSDVTSGLKQENQESLAPEDTVQSSSPNARQLVEVLREIQSQRDELEAKFLQERAALEAKFQKVVSTYIQKAI